MSLASLSMNDLINTTVKHLGLSQVKANEADWSDCWDNRRTAKQWVAYVKRQCK